MYTTPTTKRKKEREKFRDVHNTYTQKKEKKKKLKTYTSRPSTNFVKVISRHGFHKKVSFKWYLESDTI